MEPSLVEGVLRRVAAGELTPEQALPLLEAPGPAQAAPTPPAPSSPPAATAQSAAPPAASHDHGEQAPAWGTPPPDAGPPRSVRVHASYRSMEVLADPGVAEIVVTGTHSVRRDGEVLVVETMETPFGGDGEERGARFSFADLPRGLAWARSWREHHLVVRVNPELPVEIDAAGASVRVAGVEAGAKLRLIASALKLERVRGPLDLDAMSSSVKGFAAPVGPSRIACESSSVKLILGSGTDVHIRARNRMGKVVLPSTVSKGGLVDPEVSEAKVGAGRGELTVEAVMSSVLLTADSDVTTGAA